MASDARASITPQLVVGVFLTLVGTVLLLDRLQLVQAGQLRLFWPAILVAIGMSMLLRRTDPSGRFWGTLWTAVGGWLLLSALGVFNISIGQLIGPLILILIGASVMRNTGMMRCRPRRPRQRDLPAPDPFTSVEPPPAGPLPIVMPPPIPGGRGAPPIPLTNDPSGTVTLFALMGEAKRASNDKPVRGGEMTAVMGGCVLDLRQATVLPGEQAIVNVVAVMGGHEVWVPPGWLVVSDVVAVLGGVDDKRLPPLEPLPEAPPRLRLRGIVLMGGLVIKN
jgi:hypothetical protein